MAHNIKALKAHWLDLISKSRYRNNIDVLSSDIGKSDSYLRGLLRNGSVPGVDVCIALSEAIGCTPNELMDVRSSPLLDAQEIGDAISHEVSKVMTERLWGRTHQPTGDDVMSWWLANGGRLENYDFIDERFDLFEIPDGAHRNIIPFKLGKQSLSATSLGTTSHDVFERTVAPLDEKYRNMILIAQRSSIDTGPVTTIEALDAVHPDTGRKIMLEYTRTFAPVTLLGEKTLVLNYSKLLRKTGEVTGEIGKVHSA